MNLSVKNLLIVLALLSLLLVAGCNSQAQTVVFNHLQYHLVQQQGSTKIYQCVPDQGLVIEDQGSSKTYACDPNQKLQVDETANGAKVTVDSKVYLVTGTAQEMQVILPGGQAVTMHYSQNSSSGATAPGVNPTMEDWNRVDELHTLLYPEQNTPANPWLHVFGLILIGIGLLGILNPRLYWLINEGWKFENAEPSEIYLLLARIGGGVAILAGLYFLFGGI